MGVETRRASREGGEARTQTLNNIYLTEIRIITMAFETARLASKSATFTRSVPVAGITIEQDPEGATVLSSIPPVSPIPAKPQP